MSRAARLPDDKKVTRLPVKRARRAATPLPKGDVRDRRNQTKIVQDRQDAAVRLYLRALSYDEICEHLGIPRGTAHRLVHNGLERHARADKEAGVVEHARTILSGRLEALLAKWYPLALGTDGTDGEPPEPPNAGAADMVLKLLDRLARIHGVDAAPRVEGVNITVNVTNVREEIMRSLDAVEERTRQIEGVLAHDD